MKHLPRPIYLLSFLSLALLSTSTARSEIRIQDGQKVAFLGDSITYNGASNPGGYVKLVAAGLQSNGIKIEAIGAGISGNTSANMLARLEKDVLSKKPDWMALSCGVNDVWHGANGVAIEPYKANITSIVDQAMAAGIKVVIMTSTPITEDLDGDNNRKLAPYNDFLKQLAAERNIPLADSGAGLQDSIKAPPVLGAINKLTVDGVHMNPEGNKIMALAVLTAFGLDTAQLKTAEDGWMDAPGGASQPAFYREFPGKNSLTARVSLTLRQYEALQALAFKQNKSTTDYLNALYAPMVRGILKPAGGYDSIDSIFDAKKAPEVSKNLEEQLNIMVSKLLTDNPS